MAFAITRIAPISVLESKSVFSSLVERQNISLFRARLLSERITRGKKGEAVA
jgi:hypothetical protein